MSDKFVVVDFVVRPFQDQPLVSKKAKTAKIDWDKAADKVTRRVGEILTATLDERKDRVVASVEGPLEEGGFASVIVVKRPTMTDVSRMEDRLRASSPDSQQDVIIRVKVQDKESKLYVFMEATEFMLCGPSGGEWKPFVEWYKGAKELGLPIGSDVQVA